MIKRIGLIIAASLITISANAAVQLNDAPNSRERELVNVMFASYLADRPGTSVQTAVVDMDSDQVGEIIARFVHSSSCDAELKKCRTIVARFDIRRGKWGVVFDRYAQTIDSIQKAKPLPGNISVDGLNWDFDGKLQAFKPLKDDRWKPIPWQKVTGPQLEGYAAFFGQGAAKLAKENRGINVSYVRDGLSKKNDLILLKLDGEAICGQVTGCPIRLLKKSGEHWEPILTTAVENNAFSYPTSRAGYNDIVLEGKNGFVAFGWNGNDYSVAERIEAVRK